ncbi:hypothetical protein Xclt_12825 [Xanthomonas axonopodis pv. clitoriae]|uniref:Uncharacterized protein n=1 Tax=Xanthomonas axonopodis pv. clitoriae TaxID=487828 RepID=A0AB73NES5_9XANT|nr:hypothetical protein [Xanthomonas axonopodis]OOW82596.1 hypothetical protein Xclt_12825 [Xanthomonas axonopodis pv. clitoriae]
MSATPPSPTAAAAHPANAQLQALALAHQQGQLDREQYRARRRRVLDAARQTQGVTLRNALPSSSDARTSPLLGYRVTRKLRSQVVAVFVIVMLIAIILLTFHKCTSGFDRRSASGEVRHATRCAVATLAPVYAAGHVGHAQQRMVSGEMDVCV